ncbi:M20 family metallopeptidase, partial [Candidatus Bathyarchaeota archaeon]|nr:M20 family metallopeptidase [Candidatus Bathyarchaeota archaeon]
ELSEEEHASAQLLSSRAAERGFTVEHGIAGLPTAFRATCKPGSNGKRIAFLAEYDALPVVGHGCGHNIIGTAGIGAGIAVSKVMKDLAGEVWVIGTPAEEGHGPYGGAKVRMAKGGVFDGVDVSYMIHPSTGKSTVTANFLAVKGVGVEFNGRTAHAAADPHNGVNALNAAMITYMSVHANRQQLRRDANAVIHGIITEGGLASNIIPDKAVLRFGVRSSDDTYLPTLSDIVVNCAKGAATATGCEVKLTVSDGLKSNIHNKPLEALFQRTFDELGVDYVDPLEAAVTPPGGSTDFADVTHVVPGIHPMIGLGGEGYTMHSTDFAGHTLTPEGDKGLEVGAKCMAMASVEILTSPELLAEIKTEFEKKRI